LGFANRVAHERLALHFSKAMLRSGVQLMGWGPLTLGQERMACSSAWAATSWGRKCL
jgi:hypothetical protein